MAQSLITETAEPELASFPHVLGIRSEQPRLSICMLTFNREPLLRKTLEVLRPQLTDETELLVSDNHSTDGTESFLKSLDRMVRVRRQPENVGADRNLLSCLQHAKGDYVWVMSDDDYPCSNATQEILNVLRLPDPPSVLCLRARGSDREISDYDPSYIAVNWSRKDASAYLSDVKVWVTFMSSIVVRRDLINFTFLQTKVGTSLTPAALMLHAAGRANDVAVSDVPLIYARGGNAGGYSAGIVFTKNFFRLLSECRAYGYSSASIEAAFDESLTMVVPVLVRTWALTANDHVNILWYASRRKALRTHVVPAYCDSFKRWLRKWLRGGVAKMQRSLASGVVRTLGSTDTAQGRMSYEEQCESLNSSAQKFFTASVMKVGSGTKIHHPIYLKNPAYVQIGSDFWAGPSLRLEAWDEYHGERFHPTISIGNNVRVNWNVHIGAINRIEIADNVMLGSNVLITDHAHGTLSHADLGLPPVERPLWSKGPVIIEENVWVGEGACILAGVTIGRNAIIGANAVVVRDVPPATVAGGVPARILKTSENRSNKVSAFDRL